MTEAQERAARALIEGLQHFDGYQPVPSDDTPIFAVVDYAEHEFAHANGRLCVGHLRDLASIFTTEN